MIEPKDINPLNQTYHFHGKCLKCGTMTEIWMFDGKRKPRFYNIDSEEEMKTINELACPVCKTKF